MSSGVQRTLSFSSHLQEYGWKPIVLTVSPWIYERAHPEQLADIPSSIQVSRTPALDAARHLAIGGRYWDRLALPDRWASWWLSAVPRALYLIHRHRADAIWSTYPLATAHLIGATLQLITRLPWVADFRDPMVEFVPHTGEYFPTNPALRRARLAIEEKAVRRGTRLVFCTAAAGRIVKDRYPDLDATRMSVIPNGYQEQPFLDAESRSMRPAAHGRSVLLHSGTVYPGADRDPTALFTALRELARQGHLNQSNFELRLRDPSNEKYFGALALKHEVGELVTIMPALPYREALGEMMSADGLLLLQGQTSNPAVPAKLYEYLRARRPIIALVHPEGETAATLRSLCVDSMAPLTDAGASQRLLLTWMTARSHLTAALPPPDLVSRYSRDRLTARLAAVLDDAIQSPKDSFPTPKR
jgi:hypothetical protein